MLLFGTVSCDRLQQTLLPFHSLKLVVFSCVLSSAVLLELPQHSLPGNKLQQTTNCSQNIEHTCHRPLSFVLQLPECYNSLYRIFYHVRSILKNSSARHSVDLTSITHSVIIFTNIHSIIRFTQIFNLLKSSLTLRSKRSCHLLSSLAK